MCLFRFLLLCLFSVSSLSAATEKQDSFLIIKEAINNQWGWPGLHYAISHFSQEEAELIYSLKEEDAHVLTPEITLIRRTNYTTDKWDEDYVAGSEKGLSALELSLRFNMPQLALKMIDDGVAIDSQRKDFKSRATREIRYSKNEGVHKYLGPWFYYEDEQYDIYTPLYWAIKGGFDDVVRALIENNADLSNIHTDNFKQGLKPPVKKKYGAVEVASLCENETILRIILSGQAKRYAGLDISEDTISENDLAVFKKYAQKDPGHAFLFQALLDEELEDFIAMLTYGVALEGSNDAPLDQLIKRAMLIEDERFILALYNHLQQID